MTTPIGNYGSLLPALSPQFHLTGSAIGWLAASFFVGMITANVSVGFFLDRWNLGRKESFVLALLLLFSSSLQFALSTSILWLTLNRVVCGFAVGSLFVLCLRVLAERRSLLGQGLFGAATILGPGVGTLLSPFFLAFHWRGAFVLWALLLLPGLLLVSCSRLEEGEKPLQQPSLRLSALFGQTELLLLGLLHMGTYGIGSILIGWLPLYYVSSFHLSLALASLVGTGVTLIGAVIRPVAGLMLSHGANASHLLRMSTAVILVGTGLFLLALFPIGSLFTSLSGLFFLAIGTTAPFPAIFSLGAKLAQQKQLGMGTAQGMILFASFPTLFFASPAIGWLADRSGTLVFAISVVVAFCGGLAYLTAWLALPFPAPATADQGISREHKSQRTVQEGWA